MKISMKMSISIDIPKIIIKTRNLKNKYLMVFEQVNMLVIYIIST